MARYMVFMAQDAPTMGESTGVRLYLGEHPTELAAIEAAGAVMNVRDGVHLWALEAPATITRYLVNCTRSFSTP